MGYEIGADEPKAYDYEAQSGLEKEGSVVPDDAMLTEGRGGQTQRGLKSRHIQFLLVNPFLCMRRPLILCAGLWEVPLEQVSSSDQAQSLLQPAQHHY